jgi:hypothetical protein
MPKLPEVIGHSKVIPLIFFAAMFASTSAHAADHVIGMGENSLVIWDGDTANVYFFPKAAGTVELTAWHSTYLYWDKVAAMSFYWRDNSVPNDPWHQWRNAAVGFLWPEVEQSLYSGSSTIQYKFVLQPLEADFLGVTIKLE